MLIWIMNKHWLWTDNGNGVSGYVAHNICFLKHSVPHCLQKLTNDNPLYEEPSLQHSALYYTLNMGMLSKSRLTCGCPYVYFPSMRVYSWVWLSHISPLGSTKQSVNYLNTCKTRTTVRVAALHCISTLNITLKL